MYDFIVSAEDQKNSQTVEELIKSLVEMEECGNISDEDVDECIYYLQKITDIAGINIDFDELMNSYATQI